MRIYHVGLAATQRPLEVLVGLPRRRRLVARERHPPLAHPRPLPAFSASHWDAAAWVDAVLSALARGKPLVEAAVCGAEPAVGHLHRRLGNDTVRRRRPVATGDGLRRPGDGRQGADGRPARHAPRPGHGGSLRGSLPAGAVWSCRRRAWAYRHRGGFSGAIDRYVTSAVGVSRLSPGVHAQHPSLAGRGQDSADVEGIAAAGATLCDATAHGGCRPVASNSGGCGRPGTR